MTLCINSSCDKPQSPDNAQFCQNCGSELLLKQRYRAVKVLGGGGFGKTYEVSDLGTPNKVLKVLINNSPKAVELFQREAEFLSSHDSLGIPKAEQGSYFVFQPHDGQASVHCLVMEKVEGMNLRDYLKQLGHPIDSETAERWLKELALILQEVHEQGVLHRDIKPQNIIFKPDGRLALIDFGAVREGTGTEVATAAGGRTEVASHMAGGTSIVSAGYTAPEQMNGEALRQSDFYSLGKTFIFLLTGKEPSELPYDAHEDVLQWRNKYAPKVELRLATLIDQMTSTLVRQRPASIQDLLSSLNSKQKSPIPTSPQSRPTPKPASNSNQRAESKSSTPEPTKKTKRKTSWLALSGLVGVIAAGVGAIAISQNPSYQPSVPTQQSTCTVVSSQHSVKDDAVKEIGVIQVGTQVTLTGKADPDGWTQISAPIQGWIYKGNTTTDCTQAINPTPNILPIASSPSPQQPANVTLQSPTKDNSVLLEVGMSYSQAQSLLANKGWSLSKEPECSGTGLGLCRYEFSATAEPYTKTVIITANNQSNPVVKEGSQE